IISPTLNNYGRQFFVFAYHYTRCSLLGICVVTEDQAISALSVGGEPTFFPEIFPVETWTGAREVAIVQGTSEEDVSDPVREKEALAALSVAQSSRLSGNLKRVGSSSFSLYSLQIFKNIVILTMAKSIIEHALALAPNHPDVLTEYGLFHEMLEDNVIEADLCYARALAYDPHHSEALVRRKRTLPLVNAMDAKLLRRIEAKRDKFARLPHTASLKRAMRESYFLHIYHTVAIEGNTLSLGQTRYFKFAVVMESFREPILTGLSWSPGWP
ncbi:unnamed protein product, partial [Nippostrongylus brasiliensis]|uniref:TPR_REGION domain-containing protein n=1 Tax=Nippostrongylus brasiliensis TaxID=27835 RepID=A0A0N4XPS8_NIPBR